METKLWLNESTKIKQYELIFVLLLFKQHFLDQSMNISFKYYNGLVSSLYTCSILEILVHVTKTILTFQVFSTLVLFICAMAKQSLSLVAVLSIPI